MKSRGMFGLSVVVFAIGASAAEISGVVTGPKGPEAGVWVIAETTDLPTKFSKVVVTDDRGRYLIPELPQANYSVWVRGYGLVDSKKIKSAPGKTLNLKAVAAPSAKTAAELTTNRIQNPSVMRAPICLVLNRPENISDPANGLDHLFLERIVHFST